jgi:CheY-like chemotaxis protein
MTRRILCVDDEENILKAMERTLRGEFEIETAPAASRALEKLATEGPFAVVVSDLRMPGMDGIEFLTEVRKRYPDTVRLILSGNADLTAAISAVNDGNIFQFLTKPCIPETLRSALMGALKQYELIIAERELLEETLNACVATITEILSLTNPIAFGRASRIRRYVMHMAARMELQNSWQFDLAAMLSQVGCIAVPVEVLEKINGGIAPTAEEKETFGGHPAIGASLLARIPRMGTVADMVRYQMAPVRDLRNGNIAPEVALGAQLLMIANFLDSSMTREKSRSDTLSYMRTNPEIYNPQAVAALENVEIATARFEPQMILLRDLQLDMIINQEIWTKNGLFVAPKGQTVSLLLFARLKAFDKSRGIVEPFSVQAPLQEEHPALFRPGKR